MRRGRVNGHTLERPQVAERGRPQASVRLLDKVAVLVRRPGLNNNKYLGQIKQTSMNRVQEYKHLYSS